MQKNPSIVFIPPKNETKYREDSRLNYPPNFQQNFFIPQPPQIISQPIPPQNTFSNTIYMYKPPIPQPERRFFWDKPMERFNSKLFESIDVQEIVKKGQMDKIEYYIPGLIKARLPPDDSFGTKSMRNAFQILQLGAQYLYKLRQNNFRPFGQSATAEGDQRLIEINDSMIAQTNQQLEQMQGIISQLEIQIQRLSTEVRQKKKTAKKYREKYFTVKKYQLKKEIKKNSDKKHKKIKYKKLRPEDELSEGQVPPQKLKRYQLVNVRLTNAENQEE